MNSFPKIKKAELLDCFDKLKVLFSLDKIKLIEAAIRATATSNPICLTASPLDDQIAVVRERVGRIADLKGQRLLITWIEQLYDDLSVNHAIGVTIHDFLAAVQFTRNDKSVIGFQANKTWVWTWKLNLPDDDDHIEFCIRGRDLTHADVVPSYVLQYVENSVSAYNNSRPAAALALMSIALEGTLRDALQIKGYTFTYGKSSDDVYKFEKIHISKGIGGFLVTFPNAMPEDHSIFLAPPESRVHIEAKIKRVLKKGKVYLEIRDTVDILDFWSSNVVTETGTAQISGLGTAISIGRGPANIINAIVLPADTDKVIQIVRNNLIHLSGAALQTVVIPAEGATPAITLGDYIKDDYKVFDLLCSIGQTINLLYVDIANGTLVP